MMFKPEEAWGIIKLNAKKAMRAKAVWHSPKKGAKYTLVDVLEDKIIIWREDRNTDETLTKAAVEQRALELINADGNLPTGKLITPTVAEETAFVVFHHLLECSKNGEFIVIVN